MKSLREFEFSFCTPISSIYGKSLLNSLSTSSWPRSESLVRPDSTKASLYEQRGKMMRIARFCTPSSSSERYTGRPS